MFNYKYELQMIYISLQILLYSFDYFIMFNYKYDNNMLKSFRPNMIIICLITNIHWFIWFSLISVIVPILCSSCIHLIVINNADDENIAITHEICKTILLIMNIKLMIVNIIKILI